MTDSANVTVGKTWTLVAFVTGHCQIQLKTKNAAVEIVVNGGAGTNQPGEPPEVHAGIALSSLMLNLTIQNLSGNDTVWARTLDHEAELGVIRSGA